MHGYNFEAPPKKKLAMTTTVAIKDLYKSLGYLFYGIAALKNGMDSDGLELLKRAVHRQWDQHRHLLPDFQPSHADNVDTLFDWLMLNETSAEDCMNEYNDFIRLHRDELPEAVVSFVRNAAAQISAAFGFTAGSLGLN